MSDRRRTIFINQDSGYLMIDILNAYSNEGHDCVLITGRLNVRNNPLNQGIRLERIIRYDRTSTISRLSTWIIGFLQIWIKLTFRYRRDNLFIVSNPPFAPLISLFVGNPFKLLIFDVYPDALSELGYISERSFIIKYWRRANKKVFAKAGEIFTISESMRSLLVEYVENIEIKVIQLWTDNSFLKPLKADENPFMHKYGLVEKFVVLYSGNIGLSGDVDVLVNIAARIRREDIVFLIIGDGAKKTMIAQMVNDLGLNNVIMLPWQSPSDLPYSLSAASLAVVSLSTRASKLAIPSKLVNYLSVGAPILSITSSDSEVARLVARYSCGRSFEPEDINSMADFIIAFANDKELQRTMRYNSLKASADFSLSNIKMFLA